MPRVLTFDQKCITVITSHDSAQFLRRFIIVDETWIHHYIPETKEQFKQGVRANESVLKKVKIVPSEGKVMAKFSGIFLVRCL